MTKKKTHDYISNKELLAEVIRCKQKGVCSDVLGQYFITLAKRYSGHWRFSGYSYKDEMASDAILTLVTYWDRFNEEKSDNPFAYYTQICTNAFIQYISKEKRQSDVKNSLIAENGGEAMGWGEIDMDDGDVSEVYDSRHEVETLEPREQNPEDDVV